MKTRPILFSTPMIQALLEGRKTQTRRILKNTTEHKGPYNPAYLEAYKKSEGWKQICPYGKVGDLLWVRETFLHEQNVQSLPSGGGYLYYGGKIEYVADGAQPRPIYEGETTYPYMTKRPSIFMPKWASRLTLEIINIRVERLHDISQEDAIAEGLEPLFTKEQIEKDPYLKAAHEDKQPSWINYLWHGLYGQYGGGNKKSDAWDYQYSGYPYNEAKGSYSSLWESINGKDSWDKNPWVWVMEFKVHKCNFMEMMA